MTSETAHTDAELDRRQRSRPALYTIPFAALCSVTFLGFAQNFTIQPLLPLLVFGLGGDAAIVGLIVAAFSIPSVLLRPFIGRAADEWSTHGTWRIGTIILAMVGFAYLLPSMVALFLVRIAHGAGWGAFNTGGHSTLARIAPPERRGEATSFYNLMPGIAQLAMPAVGLALATQLGLPAAFLFAAVCGALALAVMLFAPIPVESERRGPRTDFRWRALLERGAILPMIIEFMFTSAFPLFFVFVPVYALERNIPIGELALYFPAYGTVFVVTRFLIGRRADRIGRRRLLAGGVSSAAVALGLAIFATDLMGLALAGAFYAIGAAVVSPAAMALAIDRADPARIGAAMATYTLGFQLAAGVGAALWGLVIAVLGFPFPFAFAIVTQLALLGILAWQWHGLVSTHQRDARAS